MNKFNPFENFMKFMKRDFTTFDMSNFHQFSTTFGKLKVIRTDEVLPSDFWKGNLNLSVNLAPLTAPAFTRIKAVTQAFYVPYQSVWRFWNNFISDRPSNSYLNKANLASYKGVYSEPCIPAQTIQFLCKLYYGYCGLSIASDSDWYMIPTVTMFTKKAYTHTWTVVNGRRKVTCVKATMPTVDQDGHFGNSDVEIHVTRGIIQNPDIYLSAGYSDSYSFFYALLGSAIETLKDFGIPTKLMAQSSWVYDTFMINALPFLCYSKVWQDYFRNSSVQGTELDYTEINGALSQPFYFNGSLQTYYLEDLEGVSQSGWQLRMCDVPHGYNATDIFVRTNTPAGDLCDCVSLLIGYDIQRMFEISSNKLALLPSYYNGLLHQRSRNFETDLFTSAAVDPLQGATSINVPQTINELRAASKLEEFLESNTAARNFRDYIMTHWGPAPQQDTEQKAVFLGSSVIPVNISQTIQTSPSTGNDVTPLGERAGVASAFGNGDLVRKNFTDHGMIITCLSFVIDNQYFQGLPYFLKHHKDYLDYPWPEFANLGLEAIPNYLLFFGDGFNVNFMDTVNNLLVKNGSTLTRNKTTGDSNSITGVFGYTPRYSVYKYKPDQLSGDFQESMSFWNTYREFSSLPKLSHNFLSYENAVFMSNLNRIFAVDLDFVDKFYVDCFLDFSVSRALPLVSNPHLD